MPQPFLRSFLFSRAAAALLAAGGATALPAAAQTAPYTGASVFGSATGAMVLSCHTCTNYPIVLANEDEVAFAMAGGQGATTASIARATAIDVAATLAGFPDDPDTVGADYTLGGGATFAASATFSGALATPLLGARALSHNPRVYLLSLPADPDLYVGWNYFSSNATATTTQGYTFGGAARTTYTFEFSLDGLLQDPRASLGGSAFVHDGDPETGGRQRAEASLSTLLATGSQRLAQSFTIDLAFDPGETLYLEASLSASATGNFQDGLPDSGTLSADGLNTMWVSRITGGDTQWLTPALAVSAVPEPAPTALLLLGLGLLAGLHRRRG